MAYPPRNGSRPYRRRNYRRRRPSSTRKTTSGWTPVVKAAASLAASYVAKRYLNTEFKLQDTTDSGTAFNSTSGISYLLNAMTKGDDWGTRDGRSIRVTSINTRFTLNMSASATATRVRAVLVCMKDCDGTALTWSAIYSGNPTMELRNPDKLKDIKVFKDITFTLNTNNPEKTYSHYISPPVYYGRTKYNSGNVGSVADIENNAWYWFFFSDEATNTPTVQIHSRIRYVDN